MDKRSLNRGKIGNPGGGRPSVKETVWHKEKWELDEKVRALEEKIASGVYAIRDVWLLKALKGNDAILKQAADKVLADLHDVTSGGDKIFAIPSELIAKNDIASSAEPDSKGHA